MRPLLLEMTAFGSYAQKTVLPFADLRHDLYLVTGDTGAGKTTIFDAIMFALFGRASGTDRKGEMLHCDHVPKSVDTEVVLRFSQGGKEYTVSRKLHFTKKRGTEQQFGDGKLSALLEEPDRAPTEGNEKVTSRCEELLGMNAEQFRKIIMLAQGEFKEFLKADSDKKNEILGKLFDNSVYVYYQNLLLGARDTLRQRREKDASQLENLMGSSFDPSGISEEARENYLPGHPALVENLSRLTEEDQGKLDALKGRRDQIDQIIAALNTEKGAAETTNDLLAQLRGERETLAGLEALDPEMEEREKTYGRVEAAFRRAKPAVDAFDRAGRRLEDASAEIRQLTGRLEELTRWADAAQKAVDADAWIKREQDELKRKIDAIQSQLPRYRDLTQKLAEQRAARTAESEAVSSRKEAEEQRASIEEEIRRLEEKLEELDRVDVELQTRAYEKKQAEADLETLIGKNGIQNELLAIRTLEENNEAEQKRLLDLTAKAQTAMAHYGSLYRRFVSGQAGLLADGLRRELETNAGAVCPVCGSTIRPEDLAHLAVCPDDTPDQEEMERAERAKDQIEEKRGRQASAVEKNRSAIEAKKDAVLRRAGDLLPDCTGWEQLTDPAFFAVAVETAQAAAEEKRKLWTAARARQKQRDRCREQLPEKKRDRDALAETIHSLQQEAQEQDRIAAGLESAVREMRKQLLHEDEQAATAEKTALEEKEAGLARSIRAHQAALEKAKEERDTCEGTLSGKRADAEKLKSERAGAEREMERVLEETGFDSGAAMYRALAPMGEEDGETWLRSERDALDRHSYAKEHARDTIEKLEARTKGRQWVDLTELEQRLASAIQKSEQAEEACSEQDALLKNHRMVLSQVRAIREKLDASESAWRRLEKLAVLAGGSNSEGGKLSFDRYVMGTVFREILEMANRRMELMSGGRYELVHKTAAARRNAKAGLDIEVLDHITGIQRSSGTLSGGESFFTSLALALGLSDVVQNHAGGRQMDALFIDEGFGTLSGDVLEKALEVLNQLTDGNRLVGIISHVEKLDESIPQKIRVKNGENGSSLALELA